MYVLPRKINAAAPKIGVIFENTDVASQKTLTESSVCLVIYLLQLSFM